MNISNVSKQIAKMALTVMVLTGSTYAFAGADLIATKIRLYRGSGPSAAQLDLFNRGYSSARANPVRVVLVDYGYADANARLYQYYGGTSGAVDIVLPNQLGYIPFTIPALVPIQPGQLIHVRLESEDGAVNPIDTYVYACQKGTQGCE